MTHVRHTHCTHTHAHRTGGSDGKRMEVKSARPPGARRGRGGAGRRRWVPNVGGRRGGSVGELPHELLIELLLFNEPFSEPLKPPSVLSALWLKLIPNRLPPLGRMRSVTDDGRTSSRHSHGTEAGGGAARNLT